MKLYIYLIFVFFISINFTYANPYSFNLYDLPTFNNNTASVNESDNWNTNIGTLSDVNLTQFENSGGKLNIVESWLTSLINLIGDERWCKITGCTMTGDLYVGIIGNNNLLSLNNPGIGKTSSIRFLKTNDNAGISVTEYASDSTEYTFYLNDNPSTSSDKFNWFGNSWKGAGADWKMMEFSGYNVLLGGVSVTIDGAINLGNVPYYTANGIKNYIEETKSGTLSLTVDVSSRTSLGQQSIHIEITTDGTTFSAWDRIGGTQYIFDANITTSPTLITDNIYITWSDIIGGIPGDYYRFGVWPRGIITINSDTTINSDLSVLSPDNPTIKLESSGTGWPSFYSKNSIAGYKLGVDGAGGLFVITDTSTNNKPFKIYEGSSDGLLIINNDGVDISNKLNVLGNGDFTNNISIGNIIKLNNITLPLCNEAGLIARNTTSIYYCNSTIWREFNFK